MQDPTQLTTPVNPQLTVSPASDQTGQVGDPSVVSQSALIADQTSSPIQTVTDSTQTSVNPASAVDPQTATPQSSISPASDPQLIASSPTPPTDPQIPSDQNPLDVLESILAEAKQKAGQKAPAGAGSGGNDQDASASGTTTDPATPPVPPPPTPEEIAAKEAAHQAEIEQQKQQLMAQITQTPEYQARVVQETEKAEEQIKSAAGGDGFQIQQLQHTKI